MDFRILYDVTDLVQWGNVLTRVIEINLHIFRVVICCYQRVIAPGHHIHTKNATIRYCSCIFIFTSVITHSFCFFVFICISNRYAGYSFVYFGKFLELFGRVFLISETKFAFLGKSKLCLTTFQRLVQMDFILSK